MSRTISAVHRSGNKIDIERPLFRCTSLHSLAIIADAMPIPHIYLCAHLLCHLYPKSYSLSPSDIGIHYLNVVRLSLFKLGCHPLVCLCPIIISYAPCIPKKVEYFNRLLYTTDRNRRKYARIQIAPNLGFAIDDNESDLDAYCIG